MSTRFSRSAGTALEPATLSLKEVKNRDRCRMYVQVQQLLDFFSVAKNAHTQRRNKCMCAIVAVSLRPGCHYVDVNGGRRSRMLETLFPHRCSCLSHVNSHDKLHSCQGQWAH